MARIKYTETEVSWLAWLVDKARKLARRKTTGLSMAQFCALAGLERSQLSKALTAEKVDGWMVPYLMAAANEPWRAIMPRSVDVPGKAGRDPQVLMLLVVDRLRALTRLGQLPSDSEPLRATERYQAALAGEPAAWQIPTLLAALLPEGPKD